MTDTAKQQNVYKCPEFINAELIRKIVKNYLLKKNIKTDFVVNSYNVNKATSKGDNYASTLLRVSFIYKLVNNKIQDEESDSDSVILKARVNDPLMEEIMAEFNIFQRESTVYKDIMVECYEALKVIGDNTVFGPKLIYIDDMAIVQEDLTINGYQTMNRKNELTMQQCELILKKIAMFHAVTAVIHDKKPNLFKYHKIGNITEKHTPFHILFENTSKSCLKFVRSQPDLAIYGDRLEKYIENIVDKEINIFTPNKNGFNCLNHGDLWINNIMFKLDEAKENIDDVLMVDYQEGFYGSPGIDLNYFLYTSCNTDKDNVKQILLFYHKILSETLLKLNYIHKIPTYDDIYNEYLNKINHGIINTICLVPILIMENTEYADALYFIDEGDEFIPIRDQVYSNPKYARILGKVLPAFVENGWL